MYSFFKKLLSQWFGKVTLRFAKRERDLGSFSRNDV